MVLCVSFPSVDFKPLESRDHEVFMSMTGRLAQSFAQSRHSVTAVGLNYKFKPEQQELTGAMVLKLWKGLKCLQRSQGRGDLSPRRQLQTWTCRHLSVPSPPRAGVTALTWDASDFKVRLQILRPGVILSTSLHGPYLER